MSANTVLHAHRAMAEDAKIRFMANFLTLGGLKTWKLGKKAKSDYGKIETNRWLQCRYFGEGRTDTEKITFQ